MKSISYTFLLFFLINNLSGQNIETNLFDALNRFEKVTKFNGSTITFQYDEVGNRIGMIVANNQTTDFSNNIAQLGFKLYPNPTSESFCISGFEEFAALRLTDISGKVLLAKKVISDEIISISYLPKGIYIVEIITKKGVIEKKLLKK